MSGMVQEVRQEIALTWRSASIFNCALFPKTFNDNGAFYGHIQAKIFILNFKRYGRSGRSGRPASIINCALCSETLKYGNDLSATII